MKLNIANPMNDDQFEYIKKEIIRSFLMFKENSRLESLGDMVDDRYEIAVLKFLP